MKRASIKGHGQDIFFGQTAEPAPQPAAESPSSAQGQTSAHPEVSEPGHPDVPSPVRPDVQTSGRPDVQTSASQERSFFTSQNLSACAPAKVASGIAGGAKDPHHGAVQPRGDGGAEGPCLPP